MDAPIGAIVAWPGTETNLPPLIDWAPCDGRAYDAHYMNVGVLKRVLGEDTTRLPDLRGLFLRGASRTEAPGVNAHEADKATGLRDPDTTRAPGTEQGDQVGPHIHDTEAFHMQASAWDPAGANSLCDGPKTGGVTGAPVRGKSELPAGPETRVKNYGVIWLMRVR